jgi:hypothetical protein
MDGFFPKGKEGEQRAVNGSAMWVKNELEI